MGEERKGNTESYGQNARRRMSKGKISQLTDGERGTEAKEVEALKTA